MACRTGPLDTSHVTTLGAFTLLKLLVQQEEDVRTGRLSHHKGVDRTCKREKEVKRRPILARLEG